MKEVFRSRGWACPSIFEYGKVRGEHSIPCSRFTDLPPYRRIPANSHNTITSVGLNTTSCNDWGVRRRIPVSGFGLRSRGSPDSDDFNNRSCISGFYRLQVLGSTLG